MTWDAIHQQWIMVLQQEIEQCFMVLKNLKEWALLSDFGRKLGAHGGVWEC
jgi:levanase/fructan beta-fructosidase